VVTASHRKSNKGIEAEVALLNSTGETILRLPFKAEGVQEPSCSAPGNLPLTAGDWYRATLSKENSSDDLVNLEIECIRHEAGATHQLKIGEKSTASLLPQSVPASGDTTFSAIRFQAVSGWGNMGTFNAAEIKVTSVDPEAASRKVAGAYTLSTKDYTVIVHPTGGVDLYILSQDQTDQAKSGALLIGSISDYRWGAWKSSGQTPKIVIHEGSSHMQAAREGAIEFAEIATSVTDEIIQWPEVELQYPPRDGEVNPVVVRWTLAPSVARFDIETTPKNEPKLEDEGPASLHFSIAASSHFLNEDKPARWLYSPNVGVPTQETKGMVQTYNVKSRVWSVGNAYGFNKLIEEDGRLNFQVRKETVPWQRSKLQGSVAFAFGADPSATASQAVAAASHDRLTFQLESGATFFIDDEVRPIALKGTVSNLFHQPERVDLSWRTVDYDGKVVCEGNASKLLAPYDTWHPEITITPKTEGPLYLDAVARSNRGSEFQRICLGVLLRRAFTDGAESRFGISAYRGKVGTNGHTTARSEEQLLDLMRKLGVRWLRQTGDWQLARAKQFHLWYHNNVPSNAETEAYFQDQDSWLSNQERRAGFIDGNLKTALDRGAEVLEFSNEWNLHGGEKKRHARKNMPKTGSRSFTHGATSSLRAFAWVALWLPMGTFHS